jgi:hypothetical protein
MPLTDTPIGWALLLALAACGGDAGAGDDRPATGDEARAATGGAAPACLPAADVSRTVGFEVQELRPGSQARADYMICAYQATNAALGASVTTVLGPASASEELFAEMRESAESFLGAGKEPEAIQVGERGYAYGSKSKSEAAAVSGGRLYHAEAGGVGSASIGDKKAAMVEVLRQLISR